MTTVTKFDRQNLKALRAQMFERMAEVAREFGLNAEFGSIKFTDDKFTVKVEVTTNAAVEAATVDSSTPLAIGQNIKHPARTNLMQINGVYAGYITMITNRGKVYRLSNEDAIKYRVA